MLVHGAFADGSGWEGVYKILTKKGYNVSVVGNPNTSLVDDVDATKRVLARQNGPVILVGHSYGGAVITEAGNDDKVVGLVYVAAFAPMLKSHSFSYFKHCRHHLIPGWALRKMDTSGMTKQNSIPVFVLN